ncbi:acetyltransferase, gnat family [Streptococcus pneumoniae]|nr:acetyltransferase, gnat family [Streptococcus pneumoniae]
MTVIIKSMETPEEIEGKSLVHWQTWREAYDDFACRISGDNDIRKMSTL